ncbi:MAG: hypothetical protein ACOCV1_03435 [Bacillota bacterium]
MRDKTKMNNNTIYVTKGTYGNYNHSVIWVTGKDIPRDKYYYIDESKDNEPKANLLEVFAEIEWWRKLGYDIVFDNFLGEDDLEELEETKEQLKGE